jgi:hypothetical protein
MKKFAILAIALGLAGCTEMDTYFDQTFGTMGHKWGNDVQTTYMGRTWQISRSSENLNSIRAIQDNNNLNPYGRPAMRKSIQAKRAIEQATGCRVVRDTLYKNVSDVFYSDVACKNASES